MKTYRNLFHELCSFENLQRAFNKAKIRKAKKEYVLRFQKSLSNELYALQWELLTGIYKPGPLQGISSRVRKEGGEMKTPQKR